MPHRYTPEQFEFIKKHVKGRSNAELLKLFNEHFNLNLSRSQIAAFKKNNGLRSGVDSRFKPGCTPFNKGEKGLYCGGKETQFKKGKRPLNYRPVGSERISVDGYIEVKIADPGKWRMKHLVLWEKANGPVPKGHCLLFLDGNKLNVTLDNLQLITRSQLVRMNQNGLISTDAEITRTGTVIAQILSKIGERKRKVERKSES
ncbi:HNH endonuclease signature motif containing protein [Bacillus amyloliquefaciens]|uniref:HNH endonuclease signature motif containing protein n=1 Tax=Bacillus amyloliquefaciens TaxID=1390 RepID=UPI0022AFAF33|nr:HNH endonuclease signature motif containing protein [Bacillus amyloliquefaciens]MCZ4246644.1 HNH endonuclease signature motif containing protein [Bacillus amyloliquefaciens]